MGLMARALDAVFGDGRNIVVEAVGAFRPNAEAEAGRVSSDKAAALSQFAAEFAAPSRGVFDRLIDGVNRLPRPAMALGCIALFGSAMANPLWFGERMAGLALVPEPLWWLMGAVVSFYFGARHQAKGQEFQRSLAASLAVAPQVAAAVGALRGGAAGPDAPAPQPVPEAAAEPRPVAETDTAPSVAAAPTGNPALDDWRNGA